METRILAGQPRRRVAGGSLPPQTQLVDFAAMAVLLCQLPRSFTNLSLNRPSSYTHLSYLFIYQNLNSPFCFFRIL